MHLVSNLDLPASSFQTLVLLSYLLFEFFFSTYYLFFVKVFIIQTPLCFLFECDSISTLAFRVVLSLLELNVTLESSIV